jgi:hypothetical protein
MPVYVLVVPLVWLMAQTPVDALAMSVVADVARVPVGAVTAALLVWREYHAGRERQVAGVILVLALFLVGNDTLLMALGGLYLLATLVSWYVHRHGGGATATPRQVPARGLRR